MSNIIDQAQKIIEANGFSDSALSFSCSVSAISDFAIHEFDADVLFAVAFGKGSLS
jgi:hypothetical protein